jgi:hypothetical protein
MKSFRIQSIVFLLILFVFNLNTAFGWYDETHLAIAKVAGYSKWYNAVGPDIAKIKAGSTEPYNHYFDNNNNVEVTPEMVISQISKYNKSDDKEGHLYGAIIASLREYKKTLQAGKYPEYHIAFCAHYIGDLSQPLHNIPYDDFNKTHHNINDGISEAEVLKNIGRIEKNMYPINLRPNFFEEDLSREIARIANFSRMLGHKLKTENRDITKEEAYVQLGKSASLLRAILKYLGKID